ncbi:unnamed protein product [Toxocara canis]|uniref:PWI domain-containing protein n=1 Tax=Toxocara canis TaxID=6265 RepID=A0A183U735_TOXCA|nr:unnamed protein product [Toxocara canis]
MPLDMVHVRRPHFRQTIYSQIPWIYPQRIQIRRLWARIVFLPGRRYLITFVNDEELPTGRSFDLHISFSSLVDVLGVLLQNLIITRVHTLKICMSRVNLDVLKPWITAKLNEILGMEDDVLNEYVFSQLEEKTLNPKVMQINLTGFLNARRAREFMGELAFISVENVIV